MGEPGDVMLLLMDGTLYHFNYLKSDIQPEDVEPLMQKTGPFVTEYLGFGNYLRFHEEDTGWLLEKTDKYIKTAEKNESGSPLHKRTVLYKMWVNFFREHIKEKNELYGKILFRFIESKDIREHLMERGYKLSDRDVAYLIYKCSTLSVTKRHDAWRKLIEAGNDPEFEAFLKRYIELEERILKRFLDPSEIGYRCVAYLATGECISEKEIFGTIDGCLRKYENMCLRKYENMKNIIEFEVSRRISDAVTIFARVLSDGTVSEISADGLSDEEIRLRRAFNSYGFEFPCPFTEGEYLRRINGIGIFADLQLRFLACSYKPNSGMIAWCEYIDGFGDKCTSGIPILDLERDSQINLFHLP